VVCVTEFYVEGVMSSFIFLPWCTVLPRLAAADGLFLFGVKKKQKTPAENFSFEASGVA
jgi:hypothetical protein